MLSVNGYISTRCDHCWTCFISLPTKYYYNSAATTT